MFKVSISSDLKFVRMAILSEAYFSVPGGIAITGIFVLLDMNEVLLPHIIGFPSPAPVVPITIRANSGPTAYSGNTSVRNRDTHFVLICRVG